MSLLHAEYLKISRRKLYPVMLFILGFLIAITAFFLIVFAQIAPELAEGLPVLEKPEAYLIGAQQVAGQTWFPLILAVVVLGGEFATTVWATSLTRDSRKVRHVTVRLVVFSIAGTIAFLAATGVWALVAFFGAPGDGSPELGEWLGLIWRAGVISVAWTALGLGAVSMLRSVGPAIGVVLAFSFGESILSLWAPYGNVSLTAATSGLYDFVFGPGLEGLIPGSDLSRWHALAIIAGWTLIGFVLTWWGLQRRDA